MHNQPKFSVIAFFEDESFVYHHLRRAVAQKFAKGDSH